MAAWRKIFSLAVVAGAFSAAARAEPEDDPNLVQKAVSESLRRIEEYRSDLHEWEKSVRGFRRDHNFAVSTGIVTGVWRFRRFGSIQNESLPSSANYARFQYSFHLPLKRGFGYFLGSSVGSTINETTHDEGFRPPLMISLPGVLFGLAWNASPAVRFVAGADLFLERLERIHYDTESSDNPTVSITARSVALHVACDFYLKLAWAVRTEAYWRGFRTVRPNNAANYGTNVMIEKEESALGLGLAYHFI